MPPKWRNAPKGMVKGGGGGHGPKAPQPAKWSCLQQGLALGARSAPFTLVLDMKVWIAIFIEKRTNTTWRWKTLLFALSWAFSPHLSLFRNLWCQSFWQNAIVTHPSIFSLLLTLWYNLGEKKSLLMKTKTVYYHYFFFGPVRFTLLSDEAFPQTLLPPSVTGM